MELNREGSGEMYSPDNQGECMSKVGTQNFSIQGLSDMLTSLESEVTVVQPYGGLTWASMPTHILLECQHGPSHPEGRSHASGSGACAGGWPRHHLSFLL